MIFDFERPNNNPSLLVVSSSDNFVSDMSRVNSVPPNYDGRSVDDVQLFDKLEKLDKLDAYAVASSMLSENAHKYAQSDTHKAFTNKLKHNK